MTKEDCVSCSQPITNPVCVRCYLKQIDAWMKMIGMESFYRKIVSDRINRSVVYNEQNGEECILCHGESLSLCSYCFFFSVSQSLMELNFPNDFVEYFNVTFNYDGT